MKRRTRPSTPFTKRAAKRSPRLDTGAARKKCANWPSASTAFLGERPDPEAWLERALDRAQAPVEAWLDELVRAARRTVDAALAATRAAHDHPGCPPHYAAALEKDMEALEGAARAGRRGGAFAGHARLQAGAPLRPQPRRRP